MRQLILILSGHKSSGKNTIANFIANYIVNIRKQRDPWVATTSYVNFCAYADALKEFCVDVLGLEYSSCYGTNDEKNASTSYNWENVEEYLRWKFGGCNLLDNTACSIASYPSLTRREFYFMTHDGLYSAVEKKTGAMTGREVMQIFGTDLVRKNFGNVWTAATVRRIRRESKPINIITDNRFPNEIEEMLKDPLCYVLRLTRCPCGEEDKHDSEVSLDNYDWNKPKCYIIDNKDKTIEEQNNIVAKVVDEILSHGKMDQMIL